MKICISRLVPGQAGFLDPYERRGRSSCLQNPADSLIPVSQLFTHTGVVEGQLGAACLGILLGCGVDSFGKYPLKRGRGYPSTRSAGEVEGGSVVKQGHGDVIQDFHRARRCRGWRQILGRNKLLGAQHLNLSLKALCLLLPSSKTSFVISYAICLEQDEASVILSTL